MPYLLRGALIEYGSDFLGPLPNVVIFQFNPESLTRTIQIPPRPTGTGSRETSQAGEEPVESISLTAHFSAADDLANDDKLTRTFGIGPRLAALEKMVYPAGRLSGLIGKRSMPSAMPSSAVTTTRLRRNLSPVSAIPACCSSGA